MKSSVYLVFVIGTIAFAPSEANVIRNQNKRSIDIVLRSVADVFGYDILKRPSVLPPMPPPAVSTYPPPLANPPPPKAPPVVPPPQPPKAPPPPPPPAPARAPAPQPPKSPAPPPPPPPKPLLTETIQKSFNINFNWNKNIATPAPPAPPAPPQPQSPKTPPPQAPPTKAPVPKPPAPAPPPKRVNHKKPQLYQDYDYTSLQQNENLYDYDLPKQNSPQTNEELNDDYPDYNAHLNQDYSETTKTFSTKPLNDATESKEKFKSSVNEFWKTYPLTEQKGYKYIAPPVRKYEHEFVKERQNGKEICCSPVHSHLAKVKDVGTNKKSQGKSKKQRIKKKQYLSARDNDDEPHIKQNTNGPIDSADSITHPLYISLFPKQLHQLVDSESMSKPWPIPFDHEIDGTEDAEVVVKPKQFSVTVDNHNQMNTWNCCHDQSGGFTHYTVSNSSLPRSS